MCGWVHLNSLLFLAYLQEVTSCGYSQLEVAAIDALLLSACQEVGLTWAQCLHNPNQDCKQCPTWFDDTCQIAQHTA